MDLALLSSVSAKVMRRRGVSNDLRDRGDEWPLLKVVKGLSVVVATVVDEVSMFFCSGAPSACACLGPIFDYVAAASSLQRKLAVRLRGAANVSERCAIARLRSNAGCLARFTQFRQLGIPARKPKAAKSSQASLRGFKGLKRTGRCLFMLFCFALAPGPFSSQPLLVNSFYGR